MACDSHDFAAAYLHSLQVICWANYIWNIS